MHSVLLIQDGWDSTSWSNGSSKTHFFTELVFEPWTLQSMKTLSHCGHFAVAKQSHTACSEVVHNETAISSIYIPASRWKGKACLFGAVETQAACSVSVSAVLNASQVVGDSAATAAQSILSYLFQDLVPEDQKYSNMIFRYISGGTAKRTHINFVSELSRMLMLIHKASIMLMLMAHFCSKPLQKPSTFAPYSIIYFSEIDLNVIDNLCVNT